MPRQTPLPEPLRYLQPFCKQVAKLKPEEIDESMDLSLLNALLLQRIAGMSRQAAKRAIANDRELLERWIDASNCKDSGGVCFLHGYLMGLPELVDHLIEKVDKSQPRDGIFMQLPKEAKIRKRLDSGIWEVTWMGAKLWISPADRKEIESEVRSFLESARTPFVNVLVMPVAFGNVGGVKKVTQVQDQQSPDVDYALQVPGGYAQIGLAKSGPGLDESEFEQYFHTVRIVHD